MCSVMSDSLQPHGLKPSRLPVYEIFQVRILEWVTLSTLAYLSDTGSNPPLLILLHWQVCHLGSPKYILALSFSWMSFFRLKNFHFISSLLDIFI